MGVSDTFQHVILIPNNIMNKSLDKWNKENGTDFGFCFAPDHVVMRDFTNRAHVSMNDAYNFIINEWADYRDDLREAVIRLDNNKHVDDYFSLYHDPARKMYLFYWETIGGNSCPALLNQ